MRGCICQGHQNLMLVGEPFRIAAHRERLVGVLAVTLCILTDNENDPWARC